MILIREKRFIGLNDGFGGKKGQIKRLRRKSDSYKKFGPWIVEMSENALDQYPELNSEDQKKVDLILEELKTKPYQGSYGQHPLWDFVDTSHECVKVILFSKNYEGVQR